MFSTLFQVIIFQPILNLFVALYNLIPDVGIVILLVTVLIKLALYPLTAKGLQAQQSMAALQPKLEALKAKYKDDKAMLSTETINLYKEHKINPVGSCLPLLLQLPIFIALYWVLNAGLQSQQLDLLYPFVHNPGHINQISLGIFDLSQASIALAIAAGAAQYWQAKMMVQKRPPKNAGEGAKDEDMAAIMNKQMLYMMPALTVAIGWKFPAGLTLYWLISTVLTGGQQWWMIKKTPPPASGMIEGKVL